MNGFLVVVRPYDDLTLLPDIWLVTGLVTEQRKNKFRTAYAAALSRVKQRNPDEWTLEDVRRDLRSRWEIVVQDAEVAVTY